MEQLTYATRQSGKKNRQAVKQELWAKRQKRNAKASVAAHDMKERSWSKASLEKKAHGDDDEEDDEDLAAQTVIIEFKTTEGEMTGTQMEVPVDITTAQLQMLINSTLENEDPLPYSFFLNEVEIAEKLIANMKSDKVSSEEVLTIVYQPQAVFRVRSVSRCTSSLPGHTEAVLHVSFSADGQHLASGSGDATVRIWDTQTETPKLTLSGHRSWVMAVAWSPDGQLLASGGMDNEVRIWDPHTGKMRGRPLTGHKQCITALVWEPMNQLKMKKKADEVEAEMKKQEEEENAEEAAAMARKQRSDGGGDHEESKEQTLKHDNGGIKKRHYNNSSLFNLRVASASKDAVVKIWDVLHGTCLLSLSGHSQPIRCLKWGGRGVVYSGSQDRSIKCWDATTGKCIRQLDGHAHWVNDMSLNAEYALRTGPYDHTGVSVPPMQIVARSQEKYIDIVGKEESAGAVGELLASCSDDFTLYLWNPLKTNKPVVRMTGHQQPVNFIRYSPDGKYIASASFDKSVRLWHGQTGKFVAVFRAHCQSVYQVAWSADSRMLCSSSKDSTIKLWEIKTKKMVADLPGHADEVYAVDWSPDGERIASGGKDKVLKVWRS